MVVRIRTGKSIQGTLNYNERKVRQEKAELLFASGFGCEAQDLTFSEKLNRFRQLQQLNDWVRTNTLHISLNFPPEEMVSNEKMTALATDYMERIGFSGQPYLVYRHKDARHPHIHIVTTNIEQNGKSIRLHNLGKRLSEPARKAIEQIYHLIPAGNRKPRNVQITTATDLLPARYGKEETKHAITNIVGEVIRSYKFTSLEEFNIILRQMNVVAYRGRAGSRIHQGQGLVYSLLDGEGFRIGVPIKASSIYGKPTLSELQKKFAANAVKKTASKVYAGKAVNYALSRSLNEVEFASFLKEKGVILHYVQNPIGSLHDVYFVDHRYRATYSCKDLNLSLEQIYALRTGIQTRPTAFKTSATIGESRAQDHPLPNNAEAPFLSGLVLELFRSQQGAYSGYADDVTKRKKKKKKRITL